MSTRIGTSHFQDWDDAFRYYARQDYSRQDVIDLIANGVIAIGPPDNAEALRLTLDEDGRYFYEVTVNTDEPPQWFKDYMNEHKHLFTKGWKDESNANSTE